MKRKSYCEKRNLSFLSIVPYGMEKEGMGITDMILEPNCEDDIVNDSFGGETCEITV